MHRRNLLKGAGLVALYSSFPVAVSEFLASCSSGDKLHAQFFSPTQFNLIQELTDIVLPRTTTPGGIDTQTHFFIDKIVGECLSPADQQLISKGLEGLDKTNNKAFGSLSAEEKKQLISQVDEQSFKGDEGKAWFQIVKKLALIGHFTSREGMTTALNYVKVPGDYKACIPYNKGDKGLAKTFLLYW